MSHRASKIQFRPPPHPQQPTLAMQVYFNSSVFSVHSSILFYNDNLNIFYQGPTQLVYTERIKSSWLPKHTSLKRLTQKNAMIYNIFIYATLFIVWFTENLVQHLPERNESLDKSTIYALKGGVSYQIGLAAY